MTPIERDAEARDKGEALERIAEAVERKPARVLVAATTVRDEMGTRDIALVVCSDGTVWGMGYRFFRWLREVEHHSGVGRRAGLVKWAGHQVWRWCSRYWLSGPTPRAVGDGTHVVGLDIQPGIYRAPGGEWCQWFRLPDLSGDITKAHAYGVMVKQPTVEVLSTDKAFQVQNCGAWELLGAVAQPAPTITASDVAGSDNPVVAAMAGAILHASALHQVMVEINDWANNDRLAGWILARVREKHTEAENWDDLSPVGRQMIDNLMVDLEKTCPPSIEGWRMYTQAMERYKIVVKCMSERELPPALLQRRLRHPQYIIGSKEHVRQRIREISCDLAGTARTACRDGWIVRAVLSPATLSPTMKKRLPVEQSHI